MAESVWHHTVMDEEARDALVRETSAGDGAALQCLLTHYHGPLRAVVQRAIADPLRAYVDADDVLQRAYTAAFQHLDSQGFDTAARFYKWLEQIALNQLRDEQRALRRKKRDVGRIVSPHAGLTRTYSDFFQRLATDDPTPSRHVARDEAVAAVMTSLARLSDEQREVVRLRILEDTPVSEIADRLGKTEKAVYALWYRGLRALQDLIGPMQHFLTKL